MAVPEYIKPPEKSRNKFGWTNGLKKENGKLSAFEVHAYITLAINLFYFISNSAFALWGYVWYTDSDILSFLFENVVLVFDVFIWFTYLPYIFISLIVQIIGVIKADKVSVLFLVNLLLSVITPFITIFAMSQCF